MAKNRKQQLLKLIYAKCCTLPTQQLKEVREKVRDCEAKMREDNDDKDREEKEDD